MAAVRTVDQGVLKSIDELELSPKLQAWREESVDFPPIISVDRLKLVTESWKETEGEDLVIRRAKALKKVCDNIPIAIHHWQMLVGGDTEHLIAGVPHVDWCADFLPELLEQRSIELATPNYKGELCQEDQVIARECVRYWTGKTIGERYYKAFTDAVGTWYDDFVESKGTIYNHKLGLFALNVLMFERVFEVGLRGIIQECEEHIRRFTEMQESDIERLYFWRAVIIGCEGVINLATRYSKLASEMAGKEQNAERRKELEEIAKVCSQVPEKPARTFHEACQCTVFIRQGQRHETPEYAHSPGRCDQYLMPYLEREMRDGSLTLERAGELIGNLIAFQNNWVYVWEDTVKQSGCISRAISNWCLGGYQRNGDDGHNEMTYLILHMIGLMAVAEPHFIFRCSPNTPDWSYHKAIETNWKVRGGIPQFQNEQHCMEHWLDLGYPVEEARDLSGEGCAGLLPRSGACFKIQGEGSYNFPLALDLALHNGVAPVSGKRIGIETGDPRTFKTYDDLLEAVKKQWEFTLSRILWLCTLGFEEEKRHNRIPFFSAMIPGCIEKGKDITQIPQNTATLDRGWIDVADSLIAVKKLVFDERRLTMNELMDALDSNFEGERGEEIRQMCVAAPKYGNDIDEVDLLVCDLAKFSDKVIRSVPSSEGSKFYPTRLGTTWNYFGGLGVQALPNGRKSGMPLYDSSLSPGPGCDKFGPTAVMRSALKADFKESLTAILTQKFPSSLMTTPENRVKLADLTKGFMNAGGLYMQYNLVDAETLRDAQVHPENHKHLLVRVGGFSTYFVHLIKQMQDELISRTEQALV